MGIDQEVIIYGPIPYKEASGRDREIMHETVIDYCLNHTVIAKGSDKGDLVLNGIITSESQQGWKIKNDDNETVVDVRGAYSTMRNILDVDLRIIYSSVGLYLSQDLSFYYHKKMPIIDGGYYNLFKGNCTSTNMLARMHTGIGMYKYDLNKTYIDINSNSVISSFVIGEPLYGQYNYPNDDKCKLIGGLIDESYPCCFLFEQLASICRDNPGLTNDTSDELEESFLNTRLESNLTVIIDSYFKVNLTYNQTFFPVYYGKEVYSGYLKDLFVDCPDIIIYE